MDLTGFNDQQKQAVLFMDGPIAVLAGAGSGKSKVIVNRLVNLLENGVKPERIMACTFTKDAANEIKERAVNLFGLDADDMNMGTLHSICYAILSKIKKQQNPRNKLNLYNIGATWVFFTNLIKTHELKVKDIKEALGFISTCKLNCLTVNDVLKLVAKKIDNDAINEKNDREVCLYYMYKQYQNFLKSNDWIDYADMLFETYLYLSKPENDGFKNQITNTIDYLLVDEAQDMNEISYRLYSILGSKFNNIMMVGDVRQSIYGFIGSSGDYMHKFVDEYKARVIGLPLNYRSTKQIVENGNRLIAVNQIPNIENSISYRGDGDKITVIKTDDEVSEAVALTDNIISLIESGVQPKDIAVIYRINAQAFPIVDMFTMNNVPFVLHNNDNFFNRREIRQILTYLKCFVNPSECEAEDFTLISNAPLRYIKKSSLNAIDNECTGNFYDALKKANTYLDYKSAKPINDLLDDINKGNRKYINGSNTYNLIEYILDEMGFLEYLKTDDASNADMGDKANDNDRMLNIEVLLSICIKYENPKDFITYTEQVSEKSKEKKKNKNAVNLMSIHASKGLEFDHVFVAGICSRMYPFYKAQGLEQVQEERRLMYVAVTRPKNNLYLSTINSKYGRFKVRPSFFVDEMQIPKNELRLIDRTEKYVDASDRWKEQPLQAQLY